MISSMAIDGLLPEFGLATFVRKSYPVITARPRVSMHGEFSAGGWGHILARCNAHCIRLYQL